jgi:hypothetical protein
MYRVELIPKTSTLQDIIGPWVDSGRVDNSSDGVFVFENAEACHVADGTVYVSSNDKTYFYNMADFYRVKVAPV